MLKALGAALRQGGARRARCSNPTIAGSSARRPTAACASCCSSPTTCRPTSSTAPPTSACRAATSCSSDATTSTSRSISASGVVAWSSRRPSIGGPRPTCPRVATKYPRIAADHFAARGVQAEIIYVQGSVELAPLVGLADLIVDLSRRAHPIENRLWSSKRWSPSRACVVANRAAYKLRAAEITPLIDALARRFSSNARLVTHRLGHSARRATLARLVDDGPAGSTGLGIGARLAGSTAGRPVGPFGVEGFAAGRIFAAAKGDEVIGEVRRVAGGHGPARVANVTPCPAFQRGPLRLVVVAMIGGHPLVEVAGHVVHAEPAHAFGQRPRGHALIEPGKLFAAASRRSLPYMSRRAAA